MKHSEHLRQFFGAYFHQDWPDEASDWQGVVARFVKDNTTVNVARVTDEIERLAHAGLTEAELEAALLNELGCCYTPRPDLGGPSFHEWLHQLGSELRAGIDQS